MVNVVVLSDVVLFLQVEFNSISDCKYIINTTIISCGMTKSTTNNQKHPGTVPSKVKPNPQESNQKYTFVTPEGKPGAVPVHSLIAREKPGADSPKVFNHFFGQLS